MCGRFAQVIKYEQLKKLINELKIKDLSEQIEINYNLAPTQTTVAILTKDNLRYPGFFRWGLIPSWSREIGKYNLINIRSENILEKPTFKTGLSRRRCLIPANGFYEWRKGDKAPFFIHPTDSDLLYMAAIYDSWTAPDGSYIPSCGIITTAANQDISALHDRMPVILTSSAWDAWLNPQNSDPIVISTLLNPLPEGMLKLRPVSKYVNSIRNNDERCWQEETATDTIF